MPIAFDGAGDHDGDLLAGLVAEAFDGEQRGLDRAGVVASFNEEDIDAAFHQGFGLIVEILNEFGESDAAGYADRFGGGADGAGDEARLCRCGKFVGGFAGEFRGALCSGRMLRLPR